MFKPLDTQEGKKEKGQKKETATSISVYFLFLFFLSKVWFFFLDYFVGGSEFVTLFATLNKWGTNQLIISITKIYTNECVFYWTQGWSVSHSYWRMVGRHYISYVAPSLCYVILLDLASPFEKMKLGEYQPIWDFPMHQ